MKTKEILMSLKRNQLVICGLIFVVATFTRIYQLDQTTIYPDEISWMVRGKELLYAVKHANSDFFKFAWWTSSHGNEAIGIPAPLIAAIFLITLGKGQSDISLNLLPDYVAARLPMALLGSTFIVLYFLFIKRLFSYKIALASSLLLAIDPVHIGLSRWVMNDNFLSSTIFVSVFSFFLGVIDKCKKWFLVSSIAFALALLTKPNALLIFIPWLIFTILYPTGRLRNFGYFLITAVLSILFFVIAWPASWTQSFFVFIEYVIRQTNIANLGLPYYFMGEVTNSPHLSYYVFQLLTKLPLFVVIVLLSMPIVIMTLRSKKIYINSEWKLALLSVVGFMGVFFISITLVNLKLGVRYALPLWPWVYLFVGWTVITWSKLLGRNIFIFLIVLLLFSSAWSYYKFTPETALFFNSLIGGPIGAQKYDLVGLCYGMKESADYIKKCYPGVNSIAVLGCTASTSPYYFNGSVSTDVSKEKLVVVENSFKILLPKEEIIKKFDLMEPDYIVDEKGAAVARIYKMDKSLINSCR